MNKKIKKIMKVYSSDQVAVILEDIQDKFNVLSDGQKIIHNKVDKLEKNLGDKIERVDLRLMKVENKVEEIDERLVRVEDGVIEIKHKLAQKVELEDFQKLEKRMIKLEKLVFSKMAT